MLTLVHTPKPIAGLAYLCQKTVTPSGFYNDLVQQYIRDYVKMQILDFTNWFEYYLFMVYLLEILQLQTIYQHSLLQTLTEDKITLRVYGRSLFCQPQRWLNGTKTT